MSVIIPIQTIPPQNTRNQYTADGATTTFIYSFYIPPFDNPDYSGVDVWVTPQGSNVPVLQPYPSSYQVHASTTPQLGGTIVFATTPIDYTPPANSIVTIIRAVPATYNYDFSEPQRITGENLDAAFEQVTYVEQQNLTLIQDTCIKYSPATLVNPNGPGSPDPTIAPPLGSGQVWAGGVDGALVATTIETGDCSLLRSQLANEQSGTCGSLLVGHYDSIGGQAETTVFAQLNYLTNTVVDALFPVGFEQWNSFNTAQTGWLLYADGTIGNTGSGATVLASTTVQRLYEAYWNNYTDSECPVFGGRGANAAADFAANKTLRLPYKIGRTPAVIGTATQSISGTPNSPPNQVLVASSSTLESGLVVRVSAPAGSTLPTGLSAGIDYYLSVVDATHLAFATTPALAQSAPDITFSGGTGPINILVQFTQITQGFSGGFNTHSLTENEVGYHNHPPADSTDFANIHSSLNVAGGSSIGLAAKSTTGFAGQSLPFNIMQPTYGSYLFIKL